MSALRTAAVLGLIVAGVAVASVDRPGGGTVVAQTVLAPADGGNAHGWAQLRSTSHGRTLRVQLKGLPAGPGSCEVWLMSPDGHPVPLGALDPARATTFTVPPALRLVDYPYVDVSLEPPDGNPAHSADSVARGRIGG